MKLSAAQKEKLLSTLQTRFGKNKDRHKSIKWEDVLAKLESNPAKLWSLNEMEATGGEPDVVDLGKKNDEYIFIDCSAESPNGRRSFCYDAEALKARKENKPKNSAVAKAKEMGVELL